MPNSELLNTPITAAVTASIGGIVSGIDFARGALLHCNFTYGSGGTNVKAWVQSSADGGVTWHDVANFAFTTSSAKKLYNLSAKTAVTSIATPVDGSLADNTSVDGLLGDRLRVKYTTTGTYADTTLVINVVPR